jgi:hypothetical protein
MNGCCFAELAITKLSRGPQDYIKGEIYFFHSAFVLHPLLLL